MPKILNLYKEIGETPLECLERFRVGNPEYAGIKLSYLGRLDPMAEGVMIVAVGEENKKREEYLGMDKVYEVDVLFGANTDTGDILGLVLGDLQTGAGQQQEIRKDELEDVLKTFIGKRTQKYPPYSSKTVDGKPLFAWAREGKLAEIEMPEKEVEIYTIEIVEIGEMSKDAFWKLIQKRIALVKGDFRQEEILEKWKLFLKGRENAFQTLKLRISAGSGTYMRILAKEIGDKLGMPAMAIGIKRLSVGEWKIEESIR